MRVLNVAEKNSVARAVSELLSNRQCRSQQSCARYSPVYTFQYTVPELGPCEMVMTSVAGHLLELDFVPPYNKWHGCEARQLYDAAVVKSVNQGNEDVKRNLQQQARGCQVLVLWLDCDREGENIAFERSVDAALVASDIHRAISRLVDPNEHEARAVDARQEIDLRIGSSFTRLQTLLLQNKFNWSAWLPAGRESMLLSYGPCQFPTLGLIVQREWEVQAHIQEPFWSITVAYRASGESCDFSWDRHRMFDRAAAVVLHELCLESNLATVTKVDGRQRTRAAPVPLSTLEMQKRASQYLRIPGERIMRLAEELYQAGYISYPRTETNQFDTQYDLRALVGEQQQSPQWGGFAQRLVSNELWRWPRAGGSDDKAHPPIHPTKSFTEGGQSEKGRLYEFIVRHFLACCAKDAVGFETKVHIDVGGEGFTATGLMVTERNFLDVYPYERWGSNANLPVFREGQQFQPASIQLKEGQTQPPPRLSERDLIAKMEEYGIGTDATVADHIQKQAGSCTQEEGLWWLDRGYATKDVGTLLFSPTALGEALISAYRKMGLANLWQPGLRGVIESNISAVARGQRTKVGGERESVLQEAMDAFRQDFANAQRQASILVQEVAAIVFGGAAAALQGGGGPGGGGAGGGAGQPFASCTCGAQLELVTDGEGLPFVKCASYPICRRQIVFPPNATTGVDITDEACTSCTHGPVRKLQLRFRQRSLPMGHAPLQVSCVICDQQLQRLLHTIGGQERRPEELMGQPRVGAGRGRARGEGEGRPQEQEQQVTGEAGQQHLAAAEGQPEGAEVGQALRLLQGAAAGGEQAAGGKSAGREGGAGRPEAGATSLRSQLTCLQCNTSHVGDTRTTGPQQVAHETDEATKDSIRHAAEGKPGEAVKDIGEMAKNAARGAKESAKLMYDSLKDKVAGKTEDVKEQASQAADQASAKAEELKDRTKSSF
ncbi:hypothetical protein N2152v2_007020 [Parachlorella kessleri]